MKESASARKQDFTKGLQGLRGPADYAEADRGSKRSLTKSELSNFFKLKTAKAQEDA